MRLPHQALYAHVNVDEVQMKRDKKKKVRFYFVTQLVFLFYRELLTGFSVIDPRSVICPAPRS